MKLVSEARNMVVLNWFNVFPSQDLWDEFETAADNGVKTDPRRGYCIYQNGDLYNNNTLTMKIDSAIIKNSSWCHD